MGTLHLRLSLIRGPHVRGRTSEFARVVVAATNPHPIEYRPLEGSGRLDHGGSRPSPETARWVVCRGRISPTRPLDVVSALGRNLGPSSRDSFQVCPFPRSGGQRRTPRSSGSHGSCCRKKVSHPTHDERSSPERPTSIRYGTCVLLSPRTEESVHPLHAPAFTVALMSLCLDMARSRDERPLATRVRVV